MRDEPGATDSAGASCRIAEIQRSMYIAASTIASEASAPISHQSRNAPSSTRNSEAKSAEPGTASVAMPAVMTIVASAGAAAGEPADAAEQPVARAHLDDAGDQEEQHREQAVVDHLERRAGRADVVHDEDPEADQAHLRDRGVGDHAARVGLPEGHQRAPQQADDRDRHEPAPQVVRRARGRAAARSAACRRRRPWRRRPRAGPRPRAAPRGRRPAPSRGTDRAAP